MSIKRYSKKISFTLLVLLFLLCPMGGSLLGKTPEKHFYGGVHRSKHGSITMNFKGVDIRVLINFISELTGKNFLIDPAVRGKVTILSPEKVTIDEAYKVFLSVLEVNGYTTVRAGKITKIIPAAEAKSKGVETRPRRLLESPKDKIVTQLLPLKYADAADLAKLLRPFVPKTGLLISYPDTNTLIIIDVLSNINRLVRIISELDIPGAREEISLFFLENARAEDLAPKLLKVLVRKRGKGPPKHLLKIVPDKRTNSIIILATPQTTAVIEMLIGQLDGKQSRPRENIHIYVLENAVAEDLVKVLSAIPGKGPSKKKGKGKAKAPVISKDVRISADKATNSLVIIAEPDEYIVLEGIIQKLDIPRIMVYVEALIMEVSVDKAINLGVEWRVGDSYDGGYGEGSSGGFWFGGNVSPNRGLDDLATGLLSSGFIAGVLGRGITLGTVTFPTIGAFIRATKSDADFNIIATPQILTLNNEEASIEVGRNIPFVTRVDRGTNVDDRAIQSFEYKDVGITLKVTPYINRKGFVRLKIEESVKTVLSATAETGELAPTTAFRTAKTSLVVKDGQTAVIGGLIETQTTKGTNQVPWLGSIPLLGWLFKDTSDLERKTNMMVFLTPHVIRNPQEAKKLHHLKKRELENPPDQESTEEDQEEINIDHSQEPQTLEPGS